MNRFDSTFSEFIRKNYTGAEVISDLIDKPKFKNADYFLHERRVVAELKCLEEERYLAVHSILQELYNKNEIPLFKKGMTIGEVLNNHPKEDVIRSKIFRKITASLERSFKKANKQIRETKNFFNLDESKGLIVFVNIDNTILEPKIADKLISRLMQRKEENDYRYEQIDYVIYISQIHYFEDGEDKPMPFFIFTRNNAFDADEKEIFDDFRHAWIQFTGINVDGFNEVTSKDVGMLDFKSAEKDFEALLHSKKKSRNC